MHQNTSTQNLDESNVRDRVIQNLKKIDSKQHKQIYHEVLKKHNLKYSKNQNGIFLNLEDVSIDIVRELYNYINLLSETELSTKRDIMLKTIIKDGMNETNNSTPKSTSQLENKYTHCNECEQVIVDNIKTKHVDVKAILTTLEKERSSCHRKISQNKFLTAKKKFSKPIVIDTKNTCNELTLDT